MGTEITFQYKNSHLLLELHIGKNKQKGLKRKLKVIIYL